MVAGSAGLVRAYEVERGSSLELLELDRKPPYSGTSGLWASACRET